MRRSLLIYLAQTRIRRLRMGSLLAPWLRAGYLMVFRICRGGIGMALGEIHVVVFSLEKGRWTRETRRGKLFLAEVWLRVFDIGRKTTIQEIINVRIDVDERIRKFHLYPST